MLQMPGAVASTQLLAFSWTCRAVQDCTDTEHDTVLLADELTLYEIQAGWQLCDVRSGGCGHVSTRVDISGPA